MPHIQVGDVVNDPDFAQSFTILRSNTKFVLGGIENETTQVQGFGTVTVASVQDLDQVPEADRVKGAMMFHSTRPLFVTHADDVPGVSDILEWRGDKYRLVSVAPYVDWGYYRAVGVRMAGN